MITNVQLPIRAYWIAHALVISGVLIGLVIGMVAIQLYIPATNPDKTFDLYSPCAIFAVYAAASTALVAWRARDWLHVVAVHFFFFAVVYVSVLAAGVAFLCGVPFR